jgi:hypothetical protein
VEHDDHERTELDALARQELRPRVGGQPSASDADAVGAAQILDRHRRSAMKAGVPPRDLEVNELDLAVGVAPHGERATIGERMGVGATFAQHEDDASPGQRGAPSARERRIGPHHPTVIPRRPAGDKPQLVCAAQADKAAAMGQTTRGVVTRVWLEDIDQAAFTRLLRNHGDWCARSAGMDNLRVKVRSEWPAGS